PSVISHDPSGGGMYAWYRHPYELDGENRVGGVASVHARRINSDFTMEEPQTVISNRYYRDEEFAPGMCVWPADSTPQRSLIPTGGGSYRLFYPTVSQRSIFETAVTPNRLSYIDYEPSTDSWGPAGYNVADSGTYSDLDYVWEIDDSYPDLFSTYAWYLRNFSIHKTPISDTYHFTLGLPFGYHDVGFSQEGGAAYYYKWDDGDAAVVAATGVNTLVLQGTNMEMYASGIGSSAESDWEDIWSDKLEKLDPWDVIGVDPGDESRVYIAGNLGVKKRDGIDYRRGPVVGYGTNWGGANVATFWERVADGIWDKSELTPVGGSVQYGSDLYVTCSGDCFVISAWDDAHVGNWELNLWAKPKGMDMSVVAPLRLPFQTGSGLPTPPGVNEDDTIGYAFARHFSPAFYGIEEVLATGVDEGVIQASKDTMTVIWYDERDDSGLPDPSYHAAEVVTSGCFLFEAPPPPDIPPPSDVPETSGFESVEPVQIRPLAYLPRERKRYPSSSIHFIDTMDALYLEFARIIGAQDEFGEVLNSGTLSVVGTNIDDFSYSQFRNSNEGVSEFYPSVFGLNSELVSEEGTNFASVEDSEFNIDSTR
ncbi:MAG: hypothetical protein ACXAEN_26025, partial [Candidatus Thorarchaeota archaeon]